MIKTFFRGTSYCTSYAHASIILNTFKFLVKIDLQAWSKQISPWSRWNLTKALNVVISANLGSRLCNFRRGPEVLFILKDTIFRFSSSINLESSITIRNNDNQSSKVKHSSFCDDDWKTLELVNTFQGRYCIYFA